MSELERKLEGLGDLVAIEWTDVRSNGALRGLHRRKRNRDRARVAVGVASIAALAFVGIQVAKTAKEASPVANVVDFPKTMPVESVRPLEFEVIGPVAETAVLTRRSDRLELVRGHARFNVVRAVPPAEVEIGSLRVDAEDATFEITRAENVATITATRGRVHVAFNLGMTELEEGQTKTFSLSESSVPSASIAVKETAVPTATVAQEKKRLHTGPDWRGAAERGSYEVAHQLLESAGPGSVRDEPEDLLLAADVARKSHHSQEAVRPLEEVLAKHRGDVRAPMAAFTLGKVYLDDLAKPREAADKFREAYELAPTGPLADDALGREVEAANRAGDTERAKGRAELYLKTFPQGVRAQTVRRMGGLIE